MLKIYTGIGSRETPTNICKLMTALGQDLAAEGWMLRSGHAPGADQAFERGALDVHGAMEIYLPWLGFESAGTANQGYLVGHNPEAERVAAQFHPAWHLCGQGARKLHTRNVFQIVGEDLNTKTAMVICWTKDGKRSGGTGQALRIADHLQIPIFDLAICKLEDIEKFIYA